MDFVEYLSEFGEIIKESHPDMGKRTVEDYLETFAAHPPTLDEFDVSKCALEAEGERIQGNKTFMRGNYQAAAIMYTNSLKKAPTYSKCAALSYANRSAALYHLKFYEDCVSDIDRALDLPYPDNLREKILSRKESALSNLNNVTTNDTNNNDTNNNKPPVDNLKFPHGENPKLPEASRGIDIVYSPQDGRKLIAKLPFQSGDILVIEKPYLMVPHPEEDPSYCHHCLKKTLCLIPCDLCSVEVYCSVICKNEAYENYHRIECKIKSTVMAAVYVDIPKLLCQLRCLNVFTEQGTKLKQLYDDFEEIEQNPDPEKLGFTEDQFIGNTRKAFLSSLSGKELKHDPRALFEAGYIVTLLRNFTNFFQTNSDVPVVTKLLVKLSHCYILNHFPIPYFGQIDPRAHATFPLIHLASHACVNNTITYINDDGRVILRASQYIRPGDQILHNYHDLEFSFEEVSHRSGRVMQCKRICKKCDKTYVYPPERQSYVKMDKRLRSRLHKNPYDIEGLWRILSLVRGKHQHYTLQAQMIKTMLVDAYEGRSNLVVGSAQLHMFGIL